MLVEGMEAEVVTVVMGIVEALEEMAVTLQSLQVGLMGEMATMEEMAETLLAVQMGDLEVL